VCRIAEWPTNGVVLPALYIPLEWFLSWLAWKGIRSRSGYWGGMGWRVTSVAMTSVMRSVPEGRTVSCWRRAMRTWRAMDSGGGSGVWLRWSL
jgi:hypothetical protein